MKRKNTTRSALFTSIISLLLCVSMLVGTTFAWFTDEVVSGKNQIIAGNLDVELEYAKVVNGQITGWNTVAGKTDIFDPNALWEPGRVEVVYLKVSNLGSLALKYQLGVNVESETPGISVKTNAEFKLSDFLVFKTVEMSDGLTTYTDREAAQLAAGAEMGLKDYNGKTTALDPKGGANDTDYVALIVYMPETVGNEANYKTGTPAPFIELGVNLYATQKDAESDSFGPDYDENAWHPEMKVYSLEDLQNRINAGDTNIVLMNDITIPVEEMNTTAASVPAAIAITDGKNVVIDLNGKKITTTANETVATFFVHNSTVTITGEGEIEQNADGFIVWAKGNSTVNIEGGTFDGGASETSVFYASSNEAYKPESGYATINVMGGHFDSDSKNNPADRMNIANVMNHGAGRVNYYGGTFGWNPVGSEYVHVDDRNYIKVADGYQAVENTDGTYIVVKGDVLVTSDAELVDAIDDGETEIALAPGNYKLPNVQGKDITLIGVGPETVVDYSHMGGYQEVSGSSFVFKNMTVVNVEAGYPYKGLQHITSVSYENCHITGTVNLFAPATFTDCTFDSKSAEHNVVTYGSDSVTFTNCKFTYGDRAVNCYAENASSRDVKVTFTNCEFTKVAGKDTIGAIETNSSLMNSLTLTINNCTVNEGELAFISAYDSLAGANSDITVDGEEVYVVTVGNPWANDDSDAALLKKALSSDAKNIKVVLLEDISVDIGTGWGMGGANTESITIDGNGKTMTLSSTYRSYFNLANAEGKLYLEDVVLTNTHKGGHFFDYTTHFNCDVVAKNVNFQKAPLVDSGVTAVFTDCQFNQPSVDGYGLWIMSGADVTVNGGVINSERGIKITDEDSAAEATVLKVSGTKFNNIEKAAILVTTKHGAAITVENVDISACAADSTNAVWIDEDRTDYADKVTVIGATCINEP